MPRLKLPAPITLVGPSGETIEISARQVIEHVVRTGRTLGASGDVEEVRRGARVLAALSSGTTEQTGDLGPEDVEGLKAALRKPDRGWMTVAVDVALPGPPGADPNAPKRTARRLLVPQGIDLLPILDGLLSS